MSAACELCGGDGGEVLVRAGKWRVVLVDDARYPGFCRVIFNDHVKEMTDLPAADRDDLMAAVWRLEAALRAVMRPEKINLASLGNVVPHLHWHLIPRYADDAHFPGPIWGETKRTVAAQTLADRALRLPALREEIIREFTA